MFNACLETLWRNGKDIVSANRQDKGVQRQRGKSKPTQQMCFHLRICTFTIFWHKSNTTSRLIRWFFCLFVVFCLSFCISINFSQCKLYSKMCRKTGRWKPSRCHLSQNLTAWSNMKSPQASGISKVSPAEYLKLLENFDTTLKCATLSPCFNPLFIFLVATLRRLITKTTRSQMSWGNAEHEAALGYFFWKNNAEIYIFQQNT